MSCYAQELAAHFDPAVLAAFRRCVGKFEAIYDAAPEPANLTV